MHIQLDILDNTKTSKFSVVMGFPDSFRKTLGAELWMVSVLAICSLKNLVYKISIPFRIMWIKTILALSLLVTWIDCAPLDVHGCDSCNTGKNIYPKYYKHSYILWNTQLIGNVLSYSDLKKLTSKHKFFSFFVRTQIYICKSIKKPLKSRIL